MRWLLALFLLVALVPLEVAVAARGGSAVDNSAAITRAVNYLKTKQLADGGFEGSTAGSSDDFTTIRAVLALASARLPQGTFTHATSGKTALDYLRSRATAYVRDGRGRIFPGRAGQLATAVAAAEDDPFHFGGEDLVADIRATYNPTTGVYSSSASAGFSSGAAGTINQLWPIMGLHAAQQSVPTAATDNLLAQQDADNQGGWGFGFGSDLDVTSQVIESLMASGNVPASNANVQRARAYLAGQQLSTGGWPDFSGSLNADTTASVIQAFSALGVAPETIVKSGRTPFTDLLGLQRSDGGFKTYAADSNSNVLSTADTIPALGSVPFPAVRYKIRVPNIIRGAWG